MAHQDKSPSRRGDQDRPNRESNMEKAEGSRDASTIPDNEGGLSDENNGGLTEEAVGQSDEHGGGISNRPLDEEQSRQENVPPRGERREQLKED